MATMLDVDGKEFKEPTESDIAIAFDAIEKRTGFFHGGISLVTLTIEAVGSLTAAGHPAEGFSLSYNDGSPDLEYFSSETLPIDEVVKIFQMYARRDDWGKADSSGNNLRQWIQKLNASDYSGYSAWRRLPTSSFGF
jgi:hypothetical protein